MGAGGTCVEERGRRLEAVSVCGWDSFGCPQLASCYRFESIILPQEAIGSHGHAVKIRFGECDGETSRYVASYVTRA